MGAYAESKKVADRIRRHMAEAIYDLNEIQPLSVDEINELLLASRLADQWANNFPDRESVRDFALGHRR